MKIAFIGIGHASPDGVRDTDQFFMRAIDEQVETLLSEKEIACQRLPDDRDAWLDVVKDVVLRQPLLSERLW